MRYVSRDANVRAFYGASIGEGCLTLVMEHMDVSS